MPSSTDNVKLGVCTVIFDGVDLGFTKGGVEVEVATSTHEVKVDQFGETPIGETLTGRVVTAKVPLAETTLENLVRTMPGAVLTSNGVAATGTIAFLTAPPVNGDKITIAGVDFTFKTAPVGLYEIAIPATIAAAAAGLAAAIGNSGLGYIATVNAATVSLVAGDRGAAGNSVFTKTVATPANVTVAGASGGVNATKAKVTVPTGVSLSLLDFARKLILRPKGTSGAEDFTILKAATPGALTFAYKVDDERVFMANFKGYASATGDLFILGDTTA